MNRSSRIYVAGGETLLGRALLSRLQEGGFRNLVGVPPEEPDLTDRDQVEEFFGCCRPEYVFLAAGMSGGIGVNRSRPAELARHNLLVTVNVLDAAAQGEVRKLLYFASSCSYPRLAAQPMRVASLFTGPLEPTNASYAMAKLAGLQLCAAYRQQQGVAFHTAIPANVFGPHDDFEADSGHVIPALIRRCHEAMMRGEPELTIWGTGAPRREFVYAADVADAAVFVMRHYDEEEPINLGGGESYTIAEVAQAIAEVVGYAGRLVFDSSKPDGMPLKVLDSSPLFALGWRPRTEFATALTQTYAWFLQHEVMEDRRDVSATVSVAVPNSPHRRRNRARLSHR